jgi:hypothetical protein
MHRISQVRIIMDSIQPIGAIVVWIQVCFTLRTGRPAS